MHASTSTGREADADQEKKMPYDEIARIAGIASASLVFLNGTGQGALTKSMHHSYQGPA